MRRRSSGSSCWSLGARAWRSRVSPVRLVSLPCSTGPLQTPLVTLCPSLMMYVAADEQEIIRSGLRESRGKGAAKSSVARARGTRVSLRLVCLLPQLDFCLSLFISSSLSLSLSPHQVWFIDPRVWIIDPRVWIIDNLPDVCVFYQAEAAKR